MIEREFKSARWEARYCPQDGGRVTALRYDGVNLLTVAPESFSPPAESLGIYERRPVYGYDDCYPTVDACCVDGEEYADHGELWQQRWDVETADNALKFRTFCKKASAEFLREMVFDDNSLTWRFAVKNTGQKPLKFLHIMHPLMPADAVCGLDICEFEKLTVLAGDLPDIKDADALTAALLDVRDDFCEVMLSGVKQSSFCVDYSAGLRLRCGFPLKEFPCLNIWWNNGGHPAGAARREFAIEPTVGPSNVLGDLVAQNRCMKLNPGECAGWEINWVLERIF